MPDLWVVLPVIVSAAVIFLLYTIPPPWVKRYLSVLNSSDLQAALSPQSMGATLRHAYPPEDVAGIVCAIADVQRPHVKQFIVDEGIPFLAAAGSKEVAANARGGKSQLADAVGNLGGGAAGIQGIVAALAKPGKSSGVGDLVQYLPLIQQFMSSQSNGSDKAQLSVPSNGGGPAGVDWSAYR